MKKLFLLASIIGFSAQPGFAQYEHLKSDAQVLEKIGTKPTRWERVKLDTDQAGDNLWLLRFYWNPTPQTECSAAVLHTQLRIGGRTFPWPSAQEALAGLEPACYPVTPPEK